MKDALTIQVNPQEFGVQENKAGEIAELFKPMVEAMNELAPELKDITTLEINEDTCARAKDLRKKYVKIRTGTVAIHKDAKAYFLAGGRFVDAWKNAQEKASASIETALCGIEEYYINIEREKAAEKKAVRDAELQKYEIDSQFVDTGGMPDEVWDNYIAGVKAQHEARVETERKEEADRIAKEKVDREERERERAENERLRKEAEEREAALRTEREAKEKAEREAREAESRALREKQVAEKRVARVERKAGVEKKQLEKQLKNLITCPKCGHEFTMT